MELVKIVLKYLLHKPKYKASPYFSNEEIKKRTYFLAKLNM
jgi:hypothetical protein